MQPPPHWNDVEMALPDPSLPGAGLRGLANAQLSACLAGPAGQRFDLRSAPGSAPHTPFPSPSPWISSVQGEQDSAFLRLCGGFGLGIEPQFPSLRHGPPFTRFPTLRLRQGVQGKRLFRPPLRRGQELDVLPSSAAR